MNKFKRLRHLDFAEKVIICFILFLLGVFLWDISFNGALEKATFVDILKTIGEAFSGKGD